jgi:uncharacterized glyoxalase superfamily protein PhnB
MQMSPYLSFKGQCEEAFNFTVCKQLLQGADTALPWLINCDGADQ